MLEPNFYLDAEVVRELHLDNLEVLHKRVFNGEIRPALRGMDIGDDYHLCLYLGQSRVQVAGGNYLLPSAGVLQLTRQDGSILPDDEWYYLRVLEKQFSELDATDPVVVIQSGEAPEVPPQFSNAWISADAAPLPSAPPSRAAHFETLDGSSLSAAFIGELTDELAGVPVQLDRIFTSINLKLKFTPDEVRRYQTAQNVSALEKATASSGDNTGPLKPVERSKAMQNAILDALLNLGVDPKAVPRNIPGNPGVKSRVKAHLMKTRSDVTKSKFKKAYQALRDQEKIQDA